MSIFDPNGLLIPIKPIKQIGKSDCSFTCMEMILDYCGIKVSSEEISNFAIKEGDGGSFVTEMARFAKSKGLNVDCFAYNLYLTDPGDVFLDKNIFLEKLEKKLTSHDFDEFYKLMLQSTIIGIKEGINYIIKKPNLDLMTSYLDKSIPLIATVNYAALHNKQFNPYAMGHDIVLCGRNNNQIFFIDPEHAEVESINYEDFMFAFFQRKIIAASAYLLAIQK